jgi:hypothetical protein
VILVAGGEAGGVELALRGGEAGDRAELAGELAAGHRRPRVRALRGACGTAAAPQAAVDDDLAGAVLRSGELGAHRRRLREGGSRGGEQKQSGNVAHWKAPYEQEC